MKEKRNRLNIFKTKSEKETFDLAFEMGKKLKGSQILALLGPIGAGKTVFTKGLAKGLNCRDIPISSTFNLMRIYEGRLRLVHLDLFRLESEKELDFGIEDYMDEASVLVIEWPESAKSIYKRFPHIVIEIVLLKKDEREIRIRYEN